MTDSTAASDRQNAGRHGWIGVLVLSLIFSAAIALQPRPGEAVAAIFPPWIKGKEAVERVWRAEGRATGLGGLDNVVLVRGDAPDLAARLRREGALLIIDATLAGIICRVDRVD